MSSASFYKWRAKFGGMDASLISDMKDMAEENRRLKRMNAEMSMQNDLLKEALGQDLEDGAEGHSTPTDHWGDGCHSGGRPNWGPETRFLAGSNAEPQAEDARGRRLGKQNGPWSHGRSSRGANPTEFRHEV